MTSRDNILGRIRTALQDAPRPELPPPPEIWPSENPSVEEMTERFIRELEGVTGEIQRVASMDEARAKLAELLDELDWTKLGAADHPICRELTENLDDDRIDWGDGEMDAAAKGRLTAGLVAAERLLADTGTALVACPTVHQRLMCYLPPVSIIIARTDQLVEHMPAAWEDIAERASDPELRGEFVFITGPSRTADIEKILILGVHGPKRVVVLLVG